MAFERRKIDTKGLPLTLTLKWTGEVLDEGFVPLPKRLLRCARGIFRGKNRMSQLVAMLAVVDYQRPGMLKNPSLEFLAFTSGMSEELFRRSLESLQEKGLIVVKGDDDRLKITYDGLLQEIRRLTKGD